MPHWLALFAIVVVAWLLLAVVGGWLIGRGLGAIDRHHGADLDSDPGDEQPPDLRQAA